MESLKRKRAEAPRLVDAGHAQTRIGQEGIQAPKVGMAIGPAGRDAEVLSLQNLIVGLHGNVLGYFRHPAVFNTNITGGGKGAVGSVKAAGIADQNLIYHWNFPFVFEKSFWLYGGIQRFLSSRYRLFYVKTSPASCSTAGMKWGLTFFLLNIIVYTGTSERRGCFDY